MQAEATESGMQILYWELMKHVIERKLTPDRTFNIDETGFAQKSKSKRLFAVHGSQNVWSKAADALFHLTLVVACAANGYVVPPLFIVPGHCLNCDVMDKCSVEGSIITTTPKGFMNASVFLKWLVHFEDLVPLRTKRLIVLVYDGYGSHYNDAIIEKAIEIGVILVLLPANATHLIQPLDIAVFKPFKTVLKRQMEKFMIDKAVTSFSKKDSIEIRAEAWNEGIKNKKENIVAGFRSSGLWPMSFPNMQR